MQTIKVIVADDHAHVRAGLEKFLSSQTDIEVVAVVPNGYSALSILQSQIEVDVLVTDYSMPVMDGVTLTEQALELKTDLQVIILTTYPTQQIKERALKAGAKICISKQGGLDVLLKNIRMAQKG